MENNSLTSQVVNQANIVNVINAYGISLIKAGKSYKAICPFHNDKNPSMSVSPDKQIFKCFSCGTSGNVIDFVFQYENKVNTNPNFKYVDAIKKVIEICNLDIKINTETLEKGSDYLNENQRNMVNINQNINKAFVYYLKSTEAGKEALNYLHQRGLTDEIITDLGIGFCPENSALIKEKNFAKAYHVGLAKENETGRYEVLRNRITFPISNDKGDIVGFSGRILSKEKSSIKYLNTEENEVFKKGNILYNFDNAKKHIETDGLYIVEGYMDVIAAKSIELNNTVALMGTALTDNHVELLKNLNCPVNLMLDTDEPGRNAILKSIDQLEQNGIDVRVVDLDHLGSLKDLGEYHEYVLQNSNKENVEEKLKALKQMIVESKERPIIFKIKRYLERLDLTKDINLVNIEDIYQKFKTQIKGSNKIAVINYLQSISSYSHDEIKSILSPINKNYSDFLTSSINKVLDDMLIHEVSQKEDIILKNYYLQNKGNILDRANNLLQEDGGYLYQDGKIQVANLLNTILRDNKQYEKFKEMNTFKYQSLFDNCYSNNKESKISLSKNAQYQFIERFNDSFREEELEKKTNITEAYIIDKIDDLFDLLPVKMMNEFQFKDIQRNFYEKKMICFDFNTIFDSMQMRMGILDYFDKSFKASDNRLKAILIYPNQDHSIIINDKKIVKENQTIINSREKIEKSIDDKEKKIDQSYNTEMNRSIPDRYINIFVKLIQKETEKGYYFKAGRNNPRYYFAPKDICKWYGKVKRTLKISLQNMNKISEYSYNPENDKYTFIANASYQQIEKDFKVFKTEIKEEKQKKTAYMVFKEYDINAIQKKETPYAVVSIPYKGETATMMIPFSYKHKAIDGMVSFKVREDWTYTLDLNGVKERKTPKEIMQLYNQEKNIDSIDNNFDSFENSDNELERSDLLYG